jgi:hypothetical protein
MPRSVLISAWYLNTGPKGPLAQQKVDADSKLKTPGSLTTKLESLGSKADLWVFCVPE